MGRDVTIVDAGLGGLVTAPTPAEAGVPVRDHRANWGTHVLWSGPARFRFSNDQRMGR